jgi:23S rRNA (uracil1939-C5)-methyltransferase
MGPLKAGHRSEVKIERLSLGGDGIGHIGPAVVFVPYGCPGDVLEVELTDIQRNYMRAKLLRVLEPSIIRTQPPCPYHFRPGQELRNSCGGCAWQHLSYPFQLDAKRQLVQETLERIGRQRDIQVRPTLGMEDPWRYRNKVQQPVGWDGKQLITGFYAPNSHDIVAIQDCLVQPSLSVSILNRAKALLESYGVRAYDAKTQGGWIRHLLARTAGDQALLVFISRDEEFPHQTEIVDALTREFPQLVGIHQNINPGKTNVILGRLWRKAWGADHLEVSLGKLKFHLSPGSFFQVNSLQTEVLYNTVKSAAGRGDFLLDVYCGVGSITLWLAGAFKQLLGVDEVRSSIADAVQNARLNHIKNTRFIAGPAEQFMQRYRVPRGDTRSLTLVLDPPRAGCDQRVLTAVIRLRPKTIVYVSCDPGTLARDLHILTRGGFTVRSVQPIDLFPHTPHIETVVQLTLTV